MSETTRRIILCADDYGISPGVNAAIRDLVARGRLNATSVMVVAPSFSRAEAVALDTLNAAGERVAIGLHLTFTGPLKPLSPSYAPLVDGAFLPLATTLRLAVQQRLDMAALAAEMRAQFEAFAKAFGRPPDFVDGHQHVHLFPQVRHAALEAVAWMAPHAWARQCGSIRPAGAAALRSEGPAGRLFQPRIPRPRGAPRRCHQSGVCRHLYLPAGRGFPAPLPPVPRRHAAKAGSSCAIRATSMPS